eukprot:COSAG02_NODE_1196_length_13929_cov_17.931039_2_plen_121_part_00
MQLPVCKCMYISMSYSYIKYELMGLDSAGFMWTRTDARAATTRARRETESALRLILIAVRLAGLHRLRAGLVDLRALQLDRCIRSVVRKVDRQLLDPRFAGRGRSVNNAAVIPSGVSLGI